MPLGVRPSDLVHERMAGGVEEAACLVDDGVDLGDVARRVGRCLDLCEEALM